MNVQLGSTVVVGVDGSADGRRALRYAVSLASSDKLPLRLVHVCEETVYAPVLMYLPAQSIEAIGRRILRGAQDEAERLGVEASRLSSVLMRGSRPAALVGHLDDARCVVLGTRSSTLEHLFTGSTTSAVAAHASVPVHCIPERWTEHPAALGRVLVGVDGSETTTAVLEAAFAEARARSAAVEVLHAWRPDSLYDAAIEGRTFRKEWEAAARVTLEKTIGEVATRHPGVGWDLRLRFDRIAVALHEAAKDADVLVLGRRGARTPFSLLVGSTARTLLRTAPCPVVIVPLPVSDSSGRQSTTPPMV